MMCDDEDVELAASQNEDVVLAASQLHEAGAR